MRVSVLFLLLLAACDPGVSVGGAPCEYNSDCEEGLACVNGRCGSECRMHRDCPLESECLIAGDTGLGRCRLPTDTCEQCEVGLVCGEDRLCHSPCGMQCPDDGECIGGACVRVSSDAGAPSDSGPPSDGGFFGPPSYAPHEPCTDGCTGGRACIRSPGTTTSVCRTPCTDDGECGNGARCAQIDATSASTYCTIACNPVTADGCPAGEACDFLEARPVEIDGGELPSIRFWDCRRATTAGTMGAPCMPATPEDCAAGYTCLSGATDACTRYCAAVTGGGANPECATGERCSGFDMAPEVSGTPIGFCEARL